MKKAFILHGWTYSIDKYKKISTLLNSYGITTTILKVPGLTTEIDRAWDINDYVLWLKKIVDKEKDRVVLIGHSNGGRIAATYASIYPTKLDRLILIDCAGILHDEIHTKLRLLFFSTLARLGKKVSSSALLKNLLYKMNRESDYNNATHLMKKTMTNLIKKDLSLNLAKITTPTLIIWGENDKVTPVSDAKIMHRLIKDSKLYIVRGAKHSPHSTHAGEVADIIITNLSLRASAKQSPTRSGIATSRQVGTRDDKSI